MDNKYYYNRKKLYFPLTDITKRVQIHCNCNESEANEDKFI